MTMERPCKNCDAPTTHQWEVCDKCRRDPATNKCEECGKHSFVPYPFVCGTCLKDLDKVAVSFFKKHDVVNACWGEDGHIVATVENEEDAKKLPSFCCGFPVKIRYGKPVPLHAV